MMGVPVILGALVVAIIVGGVVAIILNKKK